MKRLAIIAIAWSGIASADPANARVLTAPTAWLPSEGTIVGSAGLDHRGDGSIALGYGLGGLAAVELGADTDVRTCAAPPCDTDHRAQPIWLGRAAFRLGARQDAWFAGQPAVVAGVRTTFAAAVTASFDAIRTTDAYLVASRELGPVRLHAGASLGDAGTSLTHLGPRLRPLAALEWTPGQYPKTTLLTDLAWVARLEPTRPVLERVVGFGVRYQALTWGSIELDVRAREHEGLGASTVLVRVNGVWESGKKRMSPR